MTYRRAERLLHNYNKIKAEIKNIDLEIDDIKNNYMGITAIDISREYTSETYSISDTVVKEVLKKEEMIDYLEHIKKIKINQVKKVDNALASLKEEERNFIKLRCINNVPNWKVALTYSITEEGSSMRKRRIVDSIKHLLFLV